MKNSLYLLEELNKDDIKNKKILLRVDFNVPLSKDLMVEDDTRIRAALKTINYLLSSNCTIILISHLGRPNGKIVEELRLNPIAKSLENIIKRDVIKLDDCIGKEVQNTIANINPGTIVMLENLRFYNEEEANDISFSQQLASLADIFVNDAFGVAHRAHASTVGVTSFLPSYAGFLLSDEIEALDKLLFNPKKPVISIIGGSKVSGKIEILDRLIDISDKILIGGGMAYTFIAASGFEVGKSICEENQINLVKQLVSKATNLKKEIVIPEDVHTVLDCGENVISFNVPIEKIEQNMIGLDIGEKTISTFKKVISSANTIFWNGPLGVFEVEKFAIGTNAIAREIASLYGKVYSVVGGGDSVSAINKLGLNKYFSYISTGGGASLEYISGRLLPGIKALQK